MIETRKTLGQAYPAANTLSPMYTVPAGKSAVVSTLSACNQSASADKFRISVAVNGVADAPAQYLYYDVPIAGNDTFQSTMGLTLGAGDVVRCMSGLGFVSFSLHGVEVV